MAFGFPCSGRHEYRHDTRAIYWGKSTVEEWLQLFSDPLQANSALDRLANSAYQIVIEGESYRRKLSPHVRLAAVLAAPALKNPD